MRYFRMLVVAMVILVPVSLHAATVTAIWDAVVVDDLAGYKLYRAPGPCANTTPSNFVAIKTVGKVVTTTDTVTVDGTYCYALTTLDTENLESVFSNKAEIVITQNPPLAPLNLRLSVVP